MKITDVRIFPIKEGGKAKAFASVTIEGEFAVKGIKIMEGSKGLFLSMPSRKKNDNEYEEICFPVTKEFREELQNAVLNKYNSQENFGK